MRDPRIDPRPGDVVERNSETRTVCGHGQTFVTYTLASEGDRPFILLLSEWRDMNYYATVIHTAPEEQE